MNLFYITTQRITWVITYFCMHVFCRYSVAGRQNLKNISTPLLVVANHRSYWDAMILGLLFPFFSNKYLPLGFIGDDKLFSNPFFNLFLTLNGVCPANRGKGLDVSLRKFREIIKRGGVVTIFPYGRKIFDDDARPQSGRGAATLVQEFSDLTVLPVYLNTGNNVSVFDFLFNKPTMSVIIGAPYQVRDAFNKPIEEIQDILVNSFHILK